MGEEELKSLAANLYNKGLAGSMYDAMEKAKSILNVKSQKDILEDDEDFRQLSKPQQSAPAPSDETPEFKEELKELESINTASEEKSEDKAAEENEPTLNELMRQANIDLEELEESQRQKIDILKQETQSIKQELKDAQQRPEAINHIKEEVSTVERELQELEQEREKQAQESKDSEENMEN